MGNELFFLLRLCNADQIRDRGCENFIALAAATVFFNVAESTVGAIPVTHVDPEKDKITEEWINGPGRGSVLLESGLFTWKNALYNPEEMKGMPVGIQIAGRKWEEEKLLAMMRVVDEALGKDRGFGPGSWDRVKASKSAM
jgi:Asp-tRNA(Asn)/Glu-tRNA(Gln) amidotransferase A subunit family amidase